MQSLRTSYLDLFRGLYFSLKYFNTNFGRFGTKSDFLTCIFSVVSPNHVRLTFLLFSLSPWVWVPGSGSYLLIIFDQYIC